MSYKISLKAARVNAEYTQEEAAKLLNVCKTTIVKWENGRTWPSALQLKQMCELYKVPMDAILLP